MSAQHTGYRATIDGRIMSHRGWRGQSERELAQSPDEDGYQTVRLTEDGQRKRHRVHRLVAAAHLPSQPTPSHQVRHLDGDKTNNHASNLAWGTPKENADDREAHGRTSRGKAHGDAIRANLWKSPHPNHSNMEKAHV